MPSPRFLPPLLLAWMLPPIPVIGWIVAQSFTERIGENYEYTGALIHSLATSTFAVILLASAVTNAIIISVRARYRPRSYRTSRYVLWQAGLVTLSLAWLASVFSAKAELVETALGTLIAGVSIVVCVFASLRDPDATRARLEARDGRSPEYRRRVRRARILVPAIVGALLIVAAVIAQNIEVVHRDCRVDGWGNFNGDTSLFTTNCGDFAFSGEADLDLYMGTTLDITTRGYRPGVGIQPIVVSVVER